LSDRLLGEGAGRRYRPNSDPPSERGRAAARAPPLGRPQLPGRPAPPVAVDRRLRRLHARPDAAQPVLVLLPLRHGQRPAVDRPRQLQVHVRARPHRRPAGRGARPVLLGVGPQHSVDHRLRRAAAHRLRHAHGDAADAAQARRERLPHAVLRAVDGAARGDGPRLRLPPQPRLRTDQPPHRRDPRALGAALVLRPGLGQAGAAHHGPLGHRRRHRHLPRGPPERAPRPLRGDRHRGRQRLAALSPRDAADDHAGHLLHPHHGHHRRLPVLRSGLRGRQRGQRPERRAGQARGLAALLRPVALREGLPLVPDGLRLGHGVDALHRHHGLHGGAAAHVAPLGALRRGGQ